MMTWINKKRNKKGFTLIELIVVIAILGILAAIAIPRLTGSRLTAAVNSHNASVRTIESAASVYLAEQNEQAIADINVLENYLKLPVTVPALLVSGSYTTETEFEVTAADGVVVITPGYAEVDENGDITIAADTSVE